MENANKRQHIFTACVIGSLAFMLVLAVYFPRPMALAPGVIGLLAFLSYPKFFGHWPQFPKMTVIGFVAFISFAYLGYLWAYDPDLSLTRTTKVAALLLPSLLLLGVAFTLPATQAAKYLWLIPAAIAISLILILIEILGDLALWRFIKSIPTEKAVHLPVLNRPAVAAAFLFFPAVAILRYSLPQKPRLGLYLTAILTVLFLPVIFLSDAQGAAFAFLLSGLVFVFFPYRYKAAWVFSAFILIVGILTAPWTVQWGFNNFAQQVNEMPIIGLGGGHGAQRLEIYNYLGKAILERPFLGHGIEATRSMWMEATLFSTPGTVINLNIYHPHNFALQLWVEFGLIGALAGTIFALYLLWLVYRLGSGFYQRCMFATLVSFFAIIATTFNIWHGWWLGLLMCVIAILILLNRWHHKQIQMA